MGCGCKGDKGREIKLNEKSKHGLVNIDLNIISKWGVFIILSILSPLLLPLIIITLFKIIIKNKSLNMLEILTVVGKKFKNSVKPSDIDIENLEIIELDKK